MKTFYYWGQDLLTNKPIQAESLIEAQKKIKSMIGMCPVNIQSVAEKIEEYKGRTIANWEGSIIVLTEDTRFVVGLDDSKMSGQRKFVEEANTVKSAKDYIDYVVGKNK